MKTLIEREWVRVVGHREVPGRPALYGTTKHFLDTFNLKSLEALPPLAELRDLEDPPPDLFTGIHDVPAAGEDPDSAGMSAAVEVRPADRAGAHEVVSPESGHRPAESAGSEGSAAPILGYRHDRQREGRTDSPAPETAIIRAGGKRIDREAAEGPRRRRSRVSTRNRALDRLGTGDRQRTRGVAGGAGVSRRRPARRRRVGAPSRPPAPTHPLPQAVRRGDHAP